MHTSQNNKNKFLRMPTGLILPQRQKAIAATQRIFQEDPAKNCHSQLAWFEGRNALISVALLFTLLCWVLTYPITALSSGQFWSSVSDFWSISPSQSNLPQEKYTTLNSLDREWNVMVMIKKIRTDRKKWQLQYN